VNFSVFNIVTNVLMICNLQQCRRRTKLLFILYFSQEVFCSIVFCLYTVLSRTTLGTHFLLVARVFKIKRLKIKTAVVSTSTVYICMFGVLCSFEIRCKTNETNRCYWLSKDAIDYIQQNENLKVLLYFTSHVFLTNEETNNWNENFFTKMKFHKCNRILYNSLKMKIYFLITRGKRCSIVLKTTFISGYV